MKKLFLLTIVAATTLMLQAQTISTASLNLMYCPEDYHLIEETVCNTLLNSKTWTIGTEIVGPFAIKDVDNDGKIKRSYSVEKASGCTTDYDLIVTVENCAPVAPEGAINGLFSVNSDGKQVFFSKGNLQWTTQISEEDGNDAWHAVKPEGKDIIPASVGYLGAGQGRFRFAENQWGIITYTVNSQSVSRTGIWLDMFRSGTSTYEPVPGFIGKKQSEPNYLSNWPNLHDYDWGQYNAIENGGNVPEMWRTLTQEEWSYVVNGRERASDLRARGKVHNIPGLILLPDVWTWGTGEDDDLKPEGWSSSASGYATNSYDGEIWDAMEKAGAVFLPAVGYISYSYSKQNSATDNAPQVIYHTSTISSSKVYVAPIIQNSSYEGTGNRSTSDYLPVRLVHDAN
ncbi:MAG: hypothetical protein MJZ64_07965 [Paludibacteraceae bacterium]|nr:hypothetical protein [Paludibacteraceae bacterium]